MKQSDSGFCPLFAGIAGLLLTARLGSAHPTGGNGFLLQAYAATFLGMTAFRDGEANALGTLLGAAIIAVAANGSPSSACPITCRIFLRG